MFRCNVPICSQLGIKSINVSNAKKLEDRFRVSDDGPPSARRQRVDPDVELEEATSQLSETKIEETKERIKRFYHLSQDCTENDIMKVLNYLLLRDYPDIFHLTDNAYLLKQVICVPLEYLPRVPTIPVLDQSKLKQSLMADSQLPEDKKLSAETTKTNYSKYQLSMAKEDSVEKTVFKVLKQFFSALNQNVVIINGIEMERINPERRQDSREMDLVVINHSLGLIMNIECQYSLNRGQTKRQGKKKNGQPRPSKMENLQEKLDANKKFFDDWFGADISDKWKFVSIFYCEELDFPGNCPPYAQCNHCCQYLAKGEANLKQLLEGIVQRNQIHNPVIPVEEFKTLVMFLLYCSTKFQLPIGLNFHGKLEEAMKKQGSKDTIQMWCFQTPQQKVVLYQNHLLFWSAWGTGKTLLMTWKAMKLSQMNEKVLFLIFTNGYDVKKETLLFLDLQKKFQQDENLRNNITIKQISFRDREEEPFKEDKDSNLIVVTKGKNALKDLCKNFCHVMVDEFFADFEHLSPGSQSEFGEAMSNKKTLWIALPNRYSNKPSDDVTQIPRKLQELCQTNFHEAKMDIPLRSPRNIFEELKSQVNPSRGNQIDLNEHLLKTIKLPPTLTDGRFSRVEVNPESSLTEVLKACFKELPENKVGIIVIESFMNYYPESVISCRHKVIKSMFDNAFAQIGKEAPLYWLDEYSDTIEEIKESKQKRFLLTTYELARGFEDNLIINLGGYLTFLRATSHLLTVSPTLKWPYLSLSTLTSIFEKHEVSFDHQLSLDSPLVTIGKKHKIIFSFNLKTHQKYSPFQIRNCQPWDSNDRNCFLEEESAQE